MKLDVEMKLDLDIPGAKKQVEEAARLGMRDTIVSMAADTVQGSPVLTGNNRRSINYEVSGLGLNTVVDPTKIEGAVFSTSGYGGYLETGTSKMAAQPYFRPALDRHGKDLAPNIKKHMS